MLDLQLSGSIACNAMLVYMYLSTLAVGQDILDQGLVWTLH